jgi:PhzF family phenazine biosynthesis protein
MFKKKRQPREADAKIHLVKVFSRNSKFGNLAGVVSSAQHLSKKEMQVIAKKVGASETAFIFPSGKADFKIRWFTPNVEVGFCVHATIAAVGVLKKLGCVKKNSLILESKNTLLHTKLVGRKIFLLVSDYKVIRSKINLHLIEKYLDIHPIDLSAEPEIVRIYKDSELVIPACDLGVLKNLKPNIAAYGKICKLLGVTGISIFTQETFSKRNFIHTREFAPLYGYLEDPLCGLAAGAIAGYLKNRGKNIPKILKVEQGNFLKTPGIIEVLPTKLGFYIGGNYVIKKLTHV